MAARTEALSRRERQIMDIIYTRGEASVADVRQEMADRPSYSAVRTLMNILEQKGHLRHRAEGVKYIYQPTRSRKEARRTAVQRLLKTFFDGSVTDAVAAMLETSEAKATPQDLDRLAVLIERARKEGK